jgi:hypothetical protein
MCLIAKRELTDEIVRMMNLRDIYVRMDERITGDLDIKREDNPILDFVFFYTSKITEGLGALISGDDKQIEETIEELKKYKH